MRRFPVYDPRLGSARARERDQPVEWQPERASGSRAVGVRRRVIGPQLRRRADHLKPLARRRVRRQPLPELVGAACPRLRVGVADLDEHDLSLLAAWHVSLEVGHPLPNKEFLVNVFSSLGENRREALKLASAKLPIATKIVSRSEAEIA